MYMSQRKTPCFDGDLTKQEFSRFHAHETLSGKASYAEQNINVENYRRIIEIGRGHERTLPSGTTLYREGDDCKKLYVLLDGWVSASRSLNDGRQLILNFLLPGAFLGFQTNPLLSMRDSAKCLTDSVVCEFSKKTILSLLEDNPALALSLTQNHSYEEDVITNNLINIAIRPARARVAHFLLDLHARVVNAYPLQCQTDIYLPLTRQDIADSLGLTNVHVSRAICSLQKENILSLKRRRLQIHDFAKLTEISAI